jgi:hypothetical protein
VGRVWPRHGHRGRPLNSVVRGHMRRFAVLVFAALALEVSSAVHPDHALFDQGRKPVIFIRAEGLMPLIYLRSGRPVAYLVDPAEMTTPRRTLLVNQPSMGRVHLVYSLGGRHLGWFEGGRMWDTDGAKTCQVSSSFRDSAPKNPYTQRVPSREVSREPREIPKAQPRLRFEWSKRSCTNWILGRGGDL